MSTPFPRPPRVEELKALAPKLWQNLQRWMSDLERWGNSTGGGGTGTVTQIDVNLPLTAAPDPITTTGTLDINTLTGDSGAGGLRGVVPAPAAGDAAAGKFLKADGTWAAPAGGSGAPTGAQYVVMALDATLTAERRLQVTGAATLTDGGANGDATINVLGASSAGSQFNWGKYIAGRAGWAYGG
jgi:hypothetical protein